MMTLVYQTFKRCLESLSLMEICCDSGLTPFAFLGKLSQRKQNEYFSVSLLYTCAGAVISELHGWENS